MTFNLVHNSAAFVFIIFIIIIMRVMGEGGDLHFLKDANGVKSFIT